MAGDRHDMFALADQLAVEGDFLEYLRQRRRQTMTLQDFYDELNNHDWWYAYSDDPNVYKRGSANRQRLQRIANQEGREFAALLQAFSDWALQSAGNGDRQIPKPERPEA